MVVKNFTACRDDLPSSLITNKQINRSLLVSFNDIMYHHNATVDMFVEFVRQVAILPIDRQSRCVRGISSTMYR